jgi:tripartite-type tricarboxylate transporter receptor subunit TctC
MSITAYTRCGAYAAPLMAIVATGAIAQTYPTRPIRVVVPFAAGGATDVIARVLGQRIADSVGQPVIIDNKPGGSAMIGTDIVAKATPDGHTIVMTANPHTVNPALYPKMPFDPVKDFAPITLAGLQPLIVAVHTSLPARNVKEFIAVLKANPGKYSYGTSGTAGPQHLAGEMFKVMTGTDITHVPYKGAAPATADLIGGQVQIAFGGTTNVLPHVKAGRLRALATATLKRTPFAPDLPTLDESGLTGFESTAWLGLLAPAATPRDVVARINAEAVKAIRQPETQEKLFAQGIEGVGNTPVEFAGFIRDEIAKWGKVVKAAGIRAE